MEASEAAEKVDFDTVLKGRTFRYAVKDLFSCYSEWGFSP
jgi:hypothetical protein